MNKNTKKIKFVSRDIVAFAKDPIRSVICKQDEQLSSSLQNSIYIDYHQETYDSTSGKYNGSFTVGTSDTIKLIINNIPNNIQNISDIITDICYTTDKHYENLYELQVLSRAQNLGQYFKFESLFTYNFLIKTYEEFVKNNNLKETSMPEYYSVLDNRINNSSNFKSSDLFEDENYLKTLNSTNKNNSVKIFDSRINLSTNVLSLKNYLTTLNGYKRQFPFYNQITFDIHEKDTENFCNLFNNERIYNPIFTNFNSAKKPIKFYQLENNTISQKDIPVSDFNSIYSRIFNIFTNPTTINNINTLVSKKFRSFKDVLEGKENYSEVIGYVLQKYDILSTANGALDVTGTPIQEWYIPNLSDDYLQLIDTQIKYNKNYAYRLNNIVMSIGNDYKYTSVSKFNIGEAIIHYTNEPNISLFLVENSSEYINKLLSTPPLPPQIDISPFFGSETDLRLNFNSNTGKILKEYKSFSDIETNYYNDVLKAQNRPDKKITYSSDEPLTKIQIFKTDKDPKGYEGFSINDLLTELDLSISNVSSMSMLETIEVGKSFYYMIRGLDYHDGISYPSEIYEIKSIDGVITILPYVSEKEKAEYSKNAKRYIKITPAIGQIQHSSINYNSIDLGINKESLYDKNFKLRITSKQTGRKIDINFKFKKDIQVKLT